MESTSSVERVPTPFVFTSELMGRSRRVSLLLGRRDGILGFNSTSPSSSTFTEREKFHNNNLALGSAQESLAAANNTFTRGVQGQPSLLELDMDEFSPRRGLLTSSSCSNSRYVLGILDDPRLELHVVLFFFNFGKVKPKSIWE